MGVLDKEYANEVKKQEMLYLAQASGIPRSRWKTENLYPSSQDYNTFVELKNIQNNIVSNVEKGNNIFISSRNVGNGKTSWAIKLMMAYFDNIWAGNGFTTRGLYVHVPTLLFKLKDFNNPLDPMYIENLKEVDLVIFDDIATQDKLSQYDYNQLLMIIDSRMLSGKSCIFTSNITTIEELSTSIGARLASRVYGNSDVFVFEGKDMRGYAKGE